MAPCPLSRCLAITVTVPSGAMRTKGLKVAGARVLPAVTRYVEEPFGVVVPFGIWGSEKLVPLAEDRAHLHPVSLRFGRAIDAGELFERAGRKRVAIADAIGYLTADLLPEAYRGCYADAAAELAEGRALAATLSAAR